MGIDSREVTPELTRAVVHLAAEVRSFERAEIATEKVLGQTIRRSTIRRLAKQVGQELSELEELDERSDDKNVVLAEIAVVSCDGGRIRTREAGSGRGVHLSSEKGWRETKNSSFERMCRNEKHVPNEDPCAALPSSFRTAKKVANIAEKPLPNVADPSAESTEEKPGRVKYEGPRRVLRTALSSMASSNQFGPMMQREAKRRRFDEASLRAFLGDGLNWNWTIWKKYFPTFVPILDFIHAIQYIFCAAMAMAANETEGWATYVRMITLCWQGQVDSVIEQLRNACHDQGLNLEQKIGDDDPRKPLADAVRYLTNNRTRMDYPRYRRMGLPVTSAPMESLIKQINLRVKGTEMFWDDPDGAEAILHLRAGVLSEDGRLDRYLSKRPGWPFHRRTSALATAV
jgi:hypothetical protein